MQQFRSLEQSNLRPTLISLRVDCYLMVTDRWGWGWARFNVPLDTV